MNEAEASKILNKSKASCVIREHILSQTAEKTIRRIWKRTIEELAQIYNKFPDVPKSEQMHTKAIFNAAALYIALKAVVPERAKELFEQGMAKYAKLSAKKFQRMVKMPLGKGFFLKMFAAGAKTAFGEKAGFRQQFHTADRKVLRFDILKCPYHDYLEKLGCPEIAYTFCDNDIYCYGELKGITFERTQTLGTGGEKCDFYLHR